MIFRLTSHQFDFDWVLVKYNFKNVGFKHIFRKEVFVP